MANTAQARYPGAQPFADDALARRLFHGREAETDALVHQILASRLVVLFARSGLGKTSLLNAGIAERLRDESLLPLTVRVNDSAIGPLESVYRDIEAACKRQGIEYVAGAKTSLWHFFKTAQFWRNDTLLTPVLILDQFEELFTLQSESQRSAFLDELSFVVRGVRPVPAGSSTAGAPEAGPPLSDTPPAIKFVVSLREDFLPFLEELSDRMPTILDERFRLLPLGRAAAVKALERPAAVEDPKLETRPFEVDAHAKEAILNFLERRAPGVVMRSSAYIEPFQLQLICQHIEDVARKQQRAKETGTVRIGTRELGGESKLQRILKDFYTQQVAAVPSFFQRSAVRRLCGEFLINPQGRRLRMEESEIQRLTGVKPETLETLVGRRLLRRDQVADGTYYELSHDSLVVPVLETRRLWFTLRLVQLAALGLVGLVLLVTTFAGLIGSVSEFKLVELLLATVLAVLLWLFARWVLRIFRESREMWRRLRF